LRQFQEWSGLGFVIPFIAEDTPRVTFGIIILVRPHRVDKRHKANPAQKQGNRYEIGQNFHINYLRRRAFRDTVMDEVDIANAAISGVANPATAKGTAIIL
jgi:hypothetical protein